MTYDFYDLLDVSEDASQEEVRRAFRERVREVHPDLNDDPRAPAQFTALKKGYDVLKDPVERRAYDRMGHLDYVSKRMEGLPDPDKWAPKEQTASVSRTVGSGGGSTSTAAGDSTASGASAGASTGATSGTSSASSSSSSASSAAGAASSASTANASTADAGGTTARGSSVGSSSRSARASTASTDGAGPTVASGGSTGSTRVEVSLLDRLRGNVGWPLVFATAALYLAGLAAYLEANRAGAEALVSRLAESSTADAAWLALTAADYAVVTPYEFVRAGLLGDGSAPRAALFAVGALALPTVYFVVVRMTRKARSFAWTPTYLYVLAALAPLVGVAVTAAGVADAALPAVSLAVVAVLPVLAILLLPLNAFVVPRLRARFR